MLRLSGWIQVNQEVDYKTLCIQLQAELDMKDDIIHHLENRLNLAEERVSPPTAHHSVRCVSATRILFVAHERSKTVAFY